MPGLKPQASPTFDAKENKDLSAFQLPLSALSSISRSGSPALFSTTNSPPSSDSDSSKDDVDVNINELTIKSPK